MMNLAEFRTKNYSFPDYLNYAFLPAPGIIAGKSGSLSAAYSFVPLDTQTSDYQQKARICETFNERFKELDGEWMIQFDFVRHTTDKYDLTGNFPDEITQKIEDERQLLFKELGDLYENTYKITLTWIPPNFAEKKMSSTLTGVNEHFSDIYKKFEERLNRFELDFKEFGMRRLSSTTSVSERGHTIEFDEILTHIKEAISFENHPVLTPESTMYLDTHLVYNDLVNKGTYFEYGNKKIAVIAVDGFNKEESYPLMFEALSEVPFEIRWNSRFIYLDPLAAKAKIHSIRKKWTQQIIGFKDSLLQNVSARPNIDALHKSNEGDDAIRQVDNSEVAYGYYTSVIVLTRTNLADLENDVREVESLLQKNGVQTRIESMNLFEAWLGSFPGHYMYNIRKPILNTRNLSHFLPLSGWCTGQKYNPSDKYPKNSPALCKMFTQSGGCFYLNLHQKDVSHTLVVGPTGTGKSYLLGLIEAQFARYKNAKVYIFDKEYSALSLSLACGKHYDVDEESKFSLAPFKDLKTEGELLWVEEWICNILILQGFTITQEIKADVRKAVKLTSTDENPTLTTFSTLIIDHSIRDALKPYLADGALGCLLDSKQDAIEEAWLQCFELDKLSKIGGEGTANEKYMFPVLSLIFKKIEESLDGSPTLIVIDEAWTVFKNKVFSAKVGNWLNTLRRANAGVVLATQNISEILKSEISDQILSACKTITFLPNPLANNPQIIDDYRALGLNDTQINIIAKATLMQEYYYFSPSGSRLIEPGIAPYHRAFIGSSSKDHIKRIRELHAENGSDWTRHWLKERTGL